MKRLLTIGILLLVGIQVLWAQSVNKLGYQSFSGDLYSLYSSASPLIAEIGHDGLSVHVWQGVEWERSHHLDWADLDIDNGTVNFIESAGLNDTVFMLIGGLSVADGTNAKYLIQISSDTILFERIESADGAEQVDHLIIHDGKPLISGVFSNGPSVFNLLKRERIGSWVPIGNQLTRSLRSDSIRDIASWNGELFACGRFTIFGRVYHLASLDNNNWKVVDYPPFIDESVSFGYYRDKLLLFGRDRGHQDLIQFYDGIQWTGMSEGLSNSNIIYLNGFAASNDDLYATGNFVFGGQQYSLIHFDGSTWRPMLKASEAEINAISVSDQGVLLTLRNSYLGEYHFRKRLLLKGGNPLLYTGFYLDKNQDCSYSPQADDVFTMGRETLEGAGMNFLPDQDGEIAIPAGADSITLNAQLPILHLLSCGVQSKQTLSAKNGFLYPKRTVSFSESKPKADIYLSPALSWSISAGADAMFMLCVKNSGTGILQSAELKLRFPDRFTSFTPIDPVKSVTDSLAIWEILQLHPMEERCYRFYLRVPDDLGIDEVLQIQASLESPELNWQEMKPTEKINLNKKFVPEGPVYKLAAQEPYMDYKPSFIDYKIVARNLSSRPVDRITVIDTLDPQIRITTTGIHYITSHPAQLQPSYFIDSKGRYRYVLKWVMNNINLSDSATNPQDHSAFVDFRVNLVTPDENWEICNRARVIIENLEPVSTNEICNAFRDKLTIGIPDKELLSSFKVYPNPSNGDFSVSNGSADHIQLYVSDFGGRVLFSGEIAPKTTQDIRLALKPGVYFVNTSAGEVRQLLIH